MAMEYTEEYHVGVYKSKKDNYFKKAEHPAYLLRNSLVSPSLLAGVWNAKYVNATPLYRQKKEFQRMGLAIDRTDRSYCTITSLRVMQAIQEISSRSSGESA